MAQATFNATKDCGPKLSTPTTNRNLTTFFIGERNDQSNSTERSLMAFDPTETPAVGDSIPAGSTFNTVTLRLYLTGDFCNNARTVSVFRMKQSWTETGATWNTYDGTNSWQTAGMAGANDRELTDIGTLALTASEANGYKEITLDAEKVQEWFDGDFTNEGMMYKVDTEVDDGYQYVSRSGASNNPELVIDYTPPGGGNLLAQMI